MRAWRHDIVSPPGDGDLRTIVNMQFVGKTRYLDAAGFPGRTVGLTVPPAVGKQRVSARP